MKADAIIQWFMPKEERFHDLLAQDTRNLSAAAKLFSQMAYSDSLEERKDLAPKLKNIEHEGDVLTRQIFDALNSTFITPFDREDIRAIASDLDDILDYIEAAAQSLILFELGESTEALRQFADILSRMGEQIEQVTDLIWNMSNARKIQEYIVGISDLENQADVLYGQVIADLFRGARTPIDIMKWKEIYQTLEDACDQCRDYAHVIGNVLVKNS
jgi:predicted phosphate transport protein (TIGR00153 family)